MVTPKTHGPPRGWTFMRLALLALALVPAWARAGGRADETPSRMVVACGRHTLEVASGAILVDGRRVHAGERNAKVLALPICRDDGRAVAWMERGGGQTRLLVLPVMDDPTVVLPWPLPAVGRDDRVFWIARTRVTVGPSLLAPRAVASWSETAR
jgi:hypothetical protein